MSIPKQINLSRTTTSTQLSLRLVIKTDISISTRSRRSGINQLLLDITTRVSLHSAEGGKGTELGRRMPLRR